MMTAKDLKTELKHPAEESASPACVKSFTARRPSPVEGHGFEGLASRDSGERFGVLEL